MHAQETKTLTEADAGCWLDGGLRGHYMSRDIIQLAEGYGFIVDDLASFAVEAYDSDHLDEGYPFGALIELGSEAVEWLNSGQETCAVCRGAGVLAAIGPEPCFGETTCLSCSGTRRGPRVRGQNFPPRIPDGYRWAFNDGDFGLYRLNDGEELS